MAGVDLERKTLTELVEYSKNANPQAPTGASIQIEMLRRQTIAQIEAAEATKLAARSAAVAAAAGAVASIAAVISVIVQAVK